MRPHRRRRTWAVQTYSPGGMCTAI